MYDARTDKRLDLEAYLELVPHGIANLRTRMHVVHGLPVSENDGEPDNCYVCSPYTACISYAREELTKLPRPVAWGVQCLLDLFGLPLRYGRVDRVVHVNNWLLSTNLYGAWQGQDLEALTAHLVERFPSHVIIFRSLNARTNGPALRRLQAAGYDLFCARQVWLFEPPWRVTPNVRRDERLLAEPGWHWVRVRDFARAADLYDQLYRQKYPRYNPSFRADFLRELEGRGLWEMEGLHHEGEMLGVVGWFAEEGVMTVPLVGYDTRQPPARALYRRLMARVRQVAQERGWLLNLSAGAGSFKRLRGGVPWTEYSAVYSRHLSLPRRGVLKLLQLALNHVAEPLLRRFGL